MRRNWMSVLFVTLASLVLFAVACGGRGEVSGHVAYAPQYETAPEPTTSAPLTNASAAPRSSSTTLLSMCNRDIGELKEYDLSNSSVLCMCGEGDSAIYWAVLKLERNAAGGYCHMPFGDQQVHNGVPRFLNRIAPPATSASALPAASSNVPPVGSATVAQVNQTRTVLCRDTVTEAGKIFVCTVSSSTGEDFSCTGDGFTPITADKYASYTGGAPCTCNDGSTPKEKFSHVYSCGK